MATAFVWSLALRESAPRELSISFLDTTPGFALLVETSSGKDILIDESGSKEVVTELGASLPFYTRSIDVLFAASSSVPERYAIKYRASDGDVIDLGASTTLSFGANGNKGVVKLSEKGKEVTIDGHFPVEIDGKKIFDPHLAGRQTLVLGETDTRLIAQDESKNATSKIRDLLAAAGQVNLAERSATSSCIVRGALPDPYCTPGAVFPDAGLEQICVKGYTASVRNVSVSLKRKVYAEYGIDYPQPTGTYEADHLIPLELGGSNDIANLFPEAEEPRPGFREKDLVENYLNHEVCAGRADLHAAQIQISTDWMSVYNALTPDEVKQLRSAKF